MERFSVIPLRLLLGATLTGSLLLFGAGPAAAHVETEVDDGAQAGDGPVDVRFSAEAESASAGIASTETQLPDGVLPEWVSLDSGPDGWTLSPTEAGFQVEGPPLDVGTDAEYTITIAQLPADRTEFTLKTIVRYTDGSEDAWIEESTADNPEPENPAPVITVAPAADASTSASASPSSSAPASPTPTSSAPAEPTTTPQAQITDDAGTPTWVIVAIVVVVAAVVAGGVLFWRQRSRTGT